MEKNYLSTKRPQFLPFYKILVRPFRNVCNTFITNYHIYKCPYRQDWHSLKDYVPISNISILERDA